MTAEEFDSLVRDILDGRKKVPAAVRSQLMYQMVARLYLNQHILADKVKAIEEKSIVIWVERHPAAATLLSTLAIATVILFGTPELREPFLKALQLAP
jgi:hypothetical protein